MPAYRVYQRIFEGPSRVTVEFHDYTLHQFGDVFYAVGRERGSLDGQAEPLELAIRTTRISPPRPPLAPSASPRIV
ncbi:MAG: hypothetical protein JO099_09035 [Acidobacteriia bacterium]|nr:hypothetical protein [Terriglobia bacterium]